MGTLTNTSIKNMDVKNLKFGYWQSFGLGQGARYILKYKEADFPSEYKEYKFDNFMEWVEDKPKMNEKMDFPNLPYLSFEHKGEEVYVTQSDAVLKTLGMITGLNATDLIETARVEMISGVLADILNNLLALFFEPAGLDMKKLEAMHAKDVLSGKCKQLDDHLGKFKWAAGDKLTWCDFKLFHMMQIVSSISEHLRSVHKNIDNFMNCMLNLSEDFKNYVEDQKETRMIFPTLEACKNWGLNADPTVAGLPPNQIKPKF